MKKHDTAIIYFRRALKTNDEWINEEKNRLAVIEGLNGSSCINSCFPGF
ncbi:hypothetical protein GAMM_100050 [Gammaproteobacteria bacterium]